MHESIFMQIFSLLIRAIRTTLNLEDMFIIHPQDGLLSSMYGYTPLLELTEPQQDFLVCCWDDEVDALFLS